MIVWLLALVLAGAADGAASPQSGPSKPTASAKKEKPAKAPKDPNAPAKAKKPKTDKTPTTTVASPDEPLDEDTNGEQPVVPARPARFVWKQHPSIRFGKALRLDFEAKFQEDGHSSYPGSDVTAKLDSWELHRNRIGVQGTAFKHIDFEIERELTERELTEKDIAEGITAQSPWKDVKVNVDYFKDAQIQAGKFKIPFGLDQLIGVTQNDFVYRSLGANYLAPARDIGAMVHGRFFKRGLNYWAGMFRHDGDNARSKKIQGGDRTFAARVTGAPLRQVSAGFFEGLALGGAVAITHVTDDSFRPNGLRGRTVLTQDTILAPVYVKGARWRWEGDVDWVKGPGSIRAEYTHVLDERLRQGFGDEDLPKARYRSWYVSGSWLLTGETKRRPVKPAHDLFDGGFGAVEAVARIERIWFDSVDRSEDPFANPRAFTILPTGEKAFTIGLNWSLNRFAKLQINAIREQPEDPGRNPVPNGAAFWSRVFRLQLVL